MKETNPKDEVAIMKPPTTTIPQNVIAEVGVGMLEGARKYGRHNYRTLGITAGVYIDAPKRHLDYWWEGEDLDPDSGLSHVTKAICSLVVLRDAMLNDLMIDDRPPRIDVEEHRNYLEELVEDIFDRYPDARASHTDKEPKP